MREVENNPDGTFNIADVQNKMHVDGFYEPRTSLICVENTHNVLGGQIMPLEWLDEVRRSRTQNSEYLYLPLICSYLISTLVAPSCNHLSSTTL